MITLEWRSDSPEETERFGARLGAALVAPLWVGLAGEMGAGKTRFAAGVAHGLGYRGRVRSPTFVLENRFEGTVPIRHLDLYRLDAPDEEMVASWEDDPRSIVMVEWSERASERPARTLDVSIEVAGESTRWIRVRWDARAELLRDLSLRPTALEGEGS